jgi:AraC-like DNA-binding protein
MTRRIRVLRDDSEYARWEVVFAAPDPALRSCVREYVGWIERTAPPITCRRELPSGDVPVIISFGPTVRERSGLHSEWTQLGSFIAGLHEGFTVVEADGPGHGMQVNFTALGASLFLNQPIRTLHNSTVDLGAVLGRSADRLAAELYDAASWDRRFAILDREILARTAVAGPLAPEIASAWNQLMMTGGRAQISHLVGQTAWSERHFIAQFRAQFGTSPKTLARIIRFGRAVRGLASGRTVSLTDLAQDCGYYDQSHFIRDFHAFAGVTPTELLASRLPDSGFVVK